MASNNAYSAEEGDACRERVKYSEEEGDACRERVKTLIDSLDLKKSPPSFVRVENSNIEEEPTASSTANYADSTTNSKAQGEDSTPVSISAGGEEDTNSVSQNEMPKLPGRSRQEIDTDNYTEPENDFDVEPSLHNENMQNVIWEFKITKKALEILQGSHVSQAYKKRIFGKIEKLVKGDRPPPKNMAKRISSPETKLFEAKIDKGARILWDITFPSDGEEGLRKGLRILDIVLQHDHLKRSIERIKDSIRKGTDSTVIERIYSPAGDVSSSGSLIKKCYTSTLNGLWYMLENPQVDVIFPFSTTQLELEIIQIKTTEPAPIIVHGRSGTGKTICCVYRLWHHFLGYLSNIGTPNECESLESERRDTEAIDFCQMYITKNPVLCSEVEKEFHGLCQSQKESRNFMKDKRETSPNNLEEVLQKNFPFFVSWRRFLLMLDYMLPPPYFFERKEDGTLKDKIQGWGDTKTSLVDYSVDEDEETNNRKEITYDVFLKEMWERIKGSNKSPAVVWIEICSFILGSRKALDSEKGFLTEFKYSKLGKKEAPNFVGNKKEMYRCFLAYQNIKRKNNYFDSGDLVFNLYNRLKRYPHNNWKLHEVYVDETQDFTQSELWLLICCCENPNDIFLTGDTAQCIMNGISFRFKDLKRMFYNEQTNKSPKLFPLSTNYRSHSGILDLAASVIDLMKKFFPTSFDALERDHGIFSGPKPVFLRSSSFSQLAVFLKGGKGPSSDIEFGAGQVILVANEDAKKALPEEFPKELAHTIFEAKGLEFDDVLLYNIFSYSEDKEIWRVVRDHLDDLLQFDRRDNPNIFEIDNLEPFRPRQLTFDKEKHKQLNTELKYLYTAVTRARFNLWIFDEDVTARKPMFEFLRVSNLVRTPTAEDFDEKEDAKEFCFVKKSSSMEWEEQGNKYFQERIYSSAAYCFKKAGNSTKQKVASALDDVTRLSPGVQDYLHSAEDLLEGYMIQEALACLESARQPSLVGSLLERLGRDEEALCIYKKHNMMKDIVRLRVQQEGDDKAVDIMEGLNMYDEAAERCKQEFLTMQKSGNSDAAVLERKENRLSSICQTGAKYYHKIKKKAKMKYVLERHPKCGQAAKALVQFESKIDVKKKLDEEMPITDPFKWLDRNIHILTYAKDRLGLFAQEMFLEVLEINTVVAICLMMKHSKESCFLPSNFVENIHFWDYVYKLENKYASFFHCIENHEMIERDADGFQKCLLMLITLMAGEENKSVGPICIAFAEISKTKFDICEKLLSLALILIFNVLQSRTSDHVHQRALQFFCGLHEFPSRYDYNSFPPHIKNVFLGLSHNPTKLKLYQEVVRFLRAKNDKFLSCKWNGGNELETSEELNSFIRERLEKEHVGPLQPQTYARQDNLKRNEVGTRGKLEQHFDKPEEIHQNFIFLCLFTLIGLFLADLLWGTYHTELKYGLISEFYDWTFMMMIRIIFILGSGISLSNNRGGQ